MYARLVVGMQSQCLASGYVHPLSRKSLQGVIQTKQANIDEEAMNNYEGARYSDYDHGWDVSYIDEENSMGGGGGGSPAQPLKSCEAGLSEGATSSAQGRVLLHGHSNETSSLARHSSDGSVSTLSHQGQELNQDDEDDCVFCLEL